jgi:hypothetical protein
VLGKMAQILNCFLAGSSRIDPATDHQEDRPWFAPELTIQIDLGFRHHLVGSLTDRADLAMDDEGRPRDRAGRRTKRFLTPLQKYELYLQVVRAEVTMAEAAAAAGVDPTTVVRIRQVGKDGALSALAESRPGIRSGVRDSNWTRQRRRWPGYRKRSGNWQVKLMLVEGKGGWGVCPEREWWRCRRSSAWTVLCW